MRELMVVMNEPYWLEPVVMLVREACVVEKNRVLEYPTGHSLLVDRTLRVTHPNGEQEGIRLSKSATVECLLDDGREYLERDNDERALAEWRGEMVV